MISVGRINHHTFVSDWVTKDALVVDFGMNAGAFSYKIQNAYGCRVLGVEPNPELHGKIRQSERLKCFNWAIAKQSGKVEFHIDEGNSEASSLHVTVGRPIRITAKSFADFCTELNIRTIDLLKIDIEGEEIGLLDSDPALFSRVRQMTVEFHPFLWPEHRVPVQKIISRMRTSQFHVVDFSRDLTNVLFVNEAFARLSPADKLQLVTHKYASALHRLSRKYVGLGN